MERVCKLGYAFFSPESIIVPVYLHASDVAFLTSISVMYDSQSNREDPELSMSIGGIPPNVV